MPWKIPDSISSDVLFDFREEVEERLLEALSESIYEQGLQLDVLTHARGCDVKRAVLEGLNRYKVRWILARLFCHDGDHFRDGHGANSFRSLE
jgi:hypothetical protein